MALINCTECGKRISSKHPVCPYCENPMGELSPEDIARHQRRRHRRLVYRARMATYAGMTLVIVGLVVWYMRPPPGLVLPPPFAVTLMICAGLAGYVAAWAWLLWLRWKRQQEP